MRISFPIMIAAACGAVPMGIALADFGPLGAADDQALQPSELIAGAERVVQGMGRSRADLEKAAQGARKNQDLLLATCLEDKLGEITELETKAVEQFRALREAASDEAARVPFVVLTVIGQKASLVAEEAGQCVGESDTGAGLAEGGGLQPPVDPNAGVGDPPTEPAFPTDGPGVGLPVDMPPVPPAATPTR
jgi:hypothetical protein